MTSINDGKEVKSNLISGPKGKSYYIELYKTLEAALSQNLPLADRTSTLCEAWSQVHSLCSHSAPSTHPHLLIWIQRHTASTVLLTEWRGESSANERKRLEDAIDAFIQESVNANATRNGPQPSWETHLVQRGEWFKKLSANPWGHDVLLRLLDNRAEQPNDDEVLKWLQEERGVVFVCRLRQLVASKCDDIALSLAAAVMGRVRQSEPPYNDDDDEIKPTEVSENKETFGALMKSSAGFSVDVWEMLVDIEFVLLDKLEKSKECIELAKHTPLRNCYPLAERLRTRLETFPMEKRLWKNAKHVATTIAQVSVARCMSRPRCVGLVRGALYWCARVLARCVPAAALPRAAAALSARATTARHLHTLCQAMHTQCSGDMRPFVCELYVRAITAGMNELERLKLKTEKEGGAGGTVTEGGGAAGTCCMARAQEALVASWFVGLGAALGESARVRAECDLTAFSLHAAPAHYARLLHDQPPRRHKEKEEVKTGPTATTSDFGSWANDSRTQTNFVKTSETLNINSNVHQANVLSTAILNEGEALGLSPELCQDLAVLLSGPRVKTFTWDMDREQLLLDCREYMEKTGGGTKALTKELKYLNLDPSQFQHLPEESDGEDDIYYGIEKGYEKHLIEEPEPEQIWANAFSDGEMSDSKDTSYRSSYRKPPIESDDEDPLSLHVIKREEKAKRERAHSKERSRKSNKQKQDSKEHSQERETQEQELTISTNKETIPEIVKVKKERKKRQKKEKSQGVSGKDSASSSLSELVGAKVEQFNNSILTPGAVEAVAPVKVRKQRKDKGTKRAPKNTTETKGSNVPVLSSPEGGVVFDGLYSMDDLNTVSIAKDVTKKYDNVTKSVKSPELEMRKSNIKPTLKAIPVPAKPTLPVTAPTHNLAVLPQTPKKDTKEEIRKRIANLLQFRKKRTPGQFAHMAARHEVQNYQNKSLTPSSSTVSSTSTLSNTTTDPSNATFYSRSPCLNNSLNTSPTVVDTTCVQNVNNEDTTQSENVSVNTAVTKSQSSLKSAQTSTNFPNILRKSQTPTSSKIIETDKSQQSNTVLDQTNHCIKNTFNDFDNSLKVDLKSNLPFKNIPNMDNETLKQGPVLTTLLNTKVPNVSNASHATSQLFKTSFSKLIETAPNTFSRLAYMHKNKHDVKITQNEIKQISQKESISDELERHIAEVQLKKLQQQQDGLVVSRNNVNKPSASSNPVLGQILRCGSTAKNTDVSNKTKGFHVTTVGQAIDKELINLLQQQNRLNQANNSIGTMNNNTSMQYTKVMQNLTVKRVPNKHFKPKQNQAQHTPKINEQRSIGNHVLTSSEAYQASAAVVKPPAKPKRRAKTGIKACPPKPQLQKESTPNVYSNKTDNTIIKTFTAKDLQVKNTISASEVSNNNQDWESVMNQLLAHKTPSRGPNALSLVLNKKSEGQTKIEQNTVFKTETLKKSPLITTVPMKQTCNLHISYDKSINIKNEPLQKTKERSDIKILNIQNIPAKHLGKNELKSNRRPKQPKKVVTPVAEKQNIDDFAHLNDLIDTELQQEIDELTSDEDTTPSNNVKSKIRQKENNSFNTISNNYVKSANDSHIATNVTCDPVLVQNDFSHQNHAMVAATPSYMPVQNTNVNFVQQSYTITNQTNSNVVINVPVNTVSNMLFMHPSVPAESYAVVQNTYLLNDNQNVYMYTNSLNTPVLTSVSNNVQESESSDKLDAAESLISMGLGSQNLNVNKPDAYQFNSNTRDLSGENFIYPYAEAAEIKSIDSHNLNTPIDNLHSDDDKITPVINEKYSSYQKDVNYKTIENTVNTSTQSMKHNVPIDVPETPNTPANASDVFNLVNHEHQDSERKRDKRRDIINRELHHKGLHDVIPMTYEPLMCINKIDNKKIGDSNPVTNENGESVLVAKEKLTLLNDKSTARVDHKSKENKDTNECRRILLRSSNKVSGKSSCLMSVRKNKSTSNVAQENKPLISKEMTENVVLRDNIEKYTNKPENLEENPLKCKKSEEINVTTSENHLDSQISIGDSNGINNIEDVTNTSNSKSKDFEDTELPEVNVKTNSVKSIDPDHQLMQNINVDNIKFQTISDDAKSITATKPLNNVHESKDPKELILLEKSSAIDRSTSHSSNEVEVPNKCNSHHVQDDIMIDEPTPISAKQNGDEELQKSKQYSESEEKATHVLNQNTVKNTKQLADCYIIWNPRESLKEIDKKRVKKDNESVNLPREINANAAKSKDHVNSIESKSSSENAELLPPKETINKLQNENINYSITSEDDFFKQIKIFPVYKTNIGKNVEQCVRIRLPNNKSFKFTVNGKGDLKVRDLLTNPDIKSIIQSNWDDVKKFTLNINQNNKEIKVLKSKDVPKVAEVIDLLSDEEASTSKPVQSTFVTDSGTFKCPLMDNLVHEMHQKKFMCKTVVKLERLRDNLLQMYAHKAVSLDTPSESEIHTNINDQSLLPIANETETTNKVEPVSNDLNEFSSKAGVINDTVNVVNYKHAMGEKNSTQNEKYVPKTKTIKEKKIINETFENFEKITDIKLGTIENVIKIIDENKNSVAKTNSFDIDNFMSLKTGGKNYGVIELDDSSNDATCIEHEDKDKHLKTKSLNVVSEKNISTKDIENLDLLKESLLKTIDVAIESNEILKGDQKLHNGDKVIPKIAEIIDLDDSSNEAIDFININDLPEVSSKVSSKLAINDLKNMLLNDLGVTSPEIISEPIVIDDLSSGEEDVKENKLVTKKTLEKCKHDALYRKCYVPLTRCDKMVIDTIVLDDDDYDTDASSLQITTDGLESALVDSDDAIDFKETESSTRSESPSILNMWSTVKTDALQDKIDLKKQNYEETDITSSGKTDIHVKTTASDCKADWLRTKCQIIKECNSYGSLYNVHSLSSLVLHVIAKYDITSLKNTIKTVIHFNPLKRKTNFNSSWSKRFKKTPTKENIKLLNQKDDTVKENIIKENVRNIEDNLPVTLPCVYDCQHEVMEPKIDNATGIQIDTHKIPLSNQNEHLVELQQKEHDNVVHPDLSLEDPIANENILQSSKIISENSISSMKVNCVAEWMITKNLQCLECVEFLVNNPTIYNGTLLTEHDYCIEKEEPKKNGSMSDIKSDYSDDESLYPHSDSKEDVSTQMVNPGELQSGITVNKISELQLMHVSVDLNTQKDITPLASPNDIEISMCTRNEIESELNCSTPLSEDGIILKGIEIEDPIVGKVYIFRPIGDSASETDSLRNSDNSPFVDSENMNLSCESNSETVDDSENSQDTSELGTSNDNTFQNDFDSSITNDLAQSTKNIELCPNIEANEISESRDALQDNLTETICKSPKKSDVANQIYEIEQSSVNNELSSENMNLSCESNSETVDDSENSQDTSELGTGNDNTFQKDFDSSITIDLAQSTKNIELCPNIEANEISESRDALLDNLTETICKSPKKSDVANEIYEIEQSSVNNELSSENMNLSCESNSETVDDSENSQDTSELGTGNDNTFQKDFDSSITIDLAQSTKNIELCPNIEANEISESRDALLDNLTETICISPKKSDVANQNDEIGQSSVNHELTCFNGQKPVSEPTVSEDDLHNINYSVIPPKTTYFTLPYKRKIGMSDVKHQEKKYRKGKSIDYPKLSAISKADSFYGKEYKKLMNYVDAVSFSFSIPFHKEYIDVESCLVNWPIKGLMSQQNLNGSTQESHRLFLDTDDIREVALDPLMLTLEEELSQNCDETSSFQASEIQETNFKMGFGERSGRVIQNFTKQDGYLEISAATLPDVKQNQPILLSEVCKNGESLIHDEKTKINQFLNCLKLRQKVKNFFDTSRKQLLLENITKDTKKEIGLLENVPGIYDTDFLVPAPNTQIVQVVQVGQPPVSAAAQNPVTNDPRVTQVSDASPSQYCVENSPGSENNDSNMKAEYTELTNADLSMVQCLPKDDSNHEPHVNISSEQSLTSNFTSNDSPEADPKQHDTDAGVENSEKQIMYSNDGNSNDIGVIKQENDSQPTLIENPTSETKTQLQDNRTPDKTDQIAHAMNAAGISLTPDINVNSEPVVNIIPQKVIQPGNVDITINNYHNAPVNAISLQQALAQILPPPLNQTISTDGSHLNQNNVGHQVLHFVPGNNANGNPITLLDNSPQTVINSSNAQQVLHIVPNKQVGSGTISNGAAAVQQNAFGGLSLVDTGIQQGGNQLIQVVNTSGGPQTTNAGQLLNRINLITNLANVSGSNEQTMVQFVCKSADGKSIHLNAPHQRGMVLRLQPVETPTTVQGQIPTPVDQQDENASQDTLSKDNAGQHEIKSIYEENYTKFVSTPNTNGSPVTEKSTSLPKFNQAFGKPVFQEDTTKDSEIHNSSLLQMPNPETDGHSNENDLNVDHVNQLGSPQLLLRQTPVPASVALTQQNLVHQLKQTIAPMNIPTMHGGVIYTRQIPVNIGGGQTISLITVPSTELMDDSAKNQLNDSEQPMIKIVPQNQGSTVSNGEENSTNVATNGKNSGQNVQPQPVLAHMRIKLPMLSKTPQMVSGTRLVRPSFFQIQRNVIGGAYQQYVLTTAPPMTQQTIRLPQVQVPRQVKVATDNKSGSEPQMSTSTLEQLREFDMVLEQVKERSTVQPGTPNSFTKVKSSTDVTDSPVRAEAPIIYSIGNNQTVAYVARKPVVATPTTCTFTRSPDSTALDSPSSTHINDSNSSENSHAKSKCVTKSMKARSHKAPITQTPSALKVNPIPPKPPSTQRPLEDEQTTKRILYILAEYKEQVENSPDKDKPAPRRRTNPPTNPCGSSKRKRSGSRRSGCTRDHSPVTGDDAGRTMGSEDSSCGTSQGDYTESCSIDANSPQGSPRKVVRKLTFEQENANLQQPRPAPPRNVIVADGQTITVARTAIPGKPTATVLMPASYLLPMMKGGQQIAFVTKGSPKILAYGGTGEAATTNALLLQRLIGAQGKIPMLTRPGQVRQVRLPATALQAFNLASTITTHTPTSVPSETLAPAATTPPDLIETQASASPWTDQESTSEVKADPTTPESTERWNLQTSTETHEFTYESEQVSSRPNNDNRTVLDAIPDRYSPELEEQRMFDKMFDIDAKKSFVDSHDDTSRAPHGYDLESQSDSDDRTFQQVLHRKEGSSHGLQRITQVSAAALRHKYAMLEHEFKLQKSLSEECEDLGVDSPSASELFPEAELLFPASPAAPEQGGEAAPPAPSTHGHAHQTPSQTIVSQSVATPAHTIEDQIAADHLLGGDVEVSETQELEDVHLGVEVGEELQPVDQEEFARAHPNTTFHTEPTDIVEQVEPYTLASGLKGRMTSTIFQTGAPTTVLMSAPARDSNSLTHATQQAYSLHIPSTHTLTSIHKDDHLTRYDNILNDRELHLPHTASSIVHENGTQVIKRVCYDNDKQSFLMEENDIIAGNDAKMSQAEEDSRDAPLKPIIADDDRSSPERPELFWESNSASERSMLKDYSSDSEKCCKSPSLDETNSTDSSNVGSHMRLDSVIKEARSRERSGSVEGSSADDSVLPPLRTYPPKRGFHSEEERSVSGKTRAGENPDSPEVRRRLSVRGVVKRGCQCCNGSPAPLRQKKTRQRKSASDFNN